jgi:hypothetical protein
LYEYHGAVASAALGYYPSLINPILPIKNPKNVHSAMTRQKGDYRGSGGSYLPAIDPSQIAIQYLAPGQKGVPSASSPGAVASDPLDVYETDYASQNQRNIFRQALQKRLDISVRKNFKPTDRVTLQYAFNVFNIFNTTSLDVPQNQTQIRQNGACDNAVNGSAYNCTHGFLYGEVATSQTDQAIPETAGAPGGGSAGVNYDEIPYIVRSGGAVSVPTTAPATVNGCSSSKYLPQTQQCVNNGANFGSVTGTIGGARAITMALHVIF